MMKMFLFKSICLLSLMFISVLTGIQLADDGIHKMKGYSQSQSLNLTAGQGQSLSAADPFSHDIQMKQQKLEQIHAFNIFTFMGQKLSDGITNTSAKIIKSIVK